VWLTRHVHATAIVAVAVAAVGGVFVFARPQYRPDQWSKTLDMTQRRHVTVQRVRAAFADEGIRLDHGGPMLRSAPGTWAVMLSAVPAPVDTRHVQVFVFGAKAKVGWGEPEPGYEALFANVAVEYDGPSKEILGRIKAAVAELRNS